MKAQELEKYEKLKEEFSLENELASRADNAVKACKIGLRKMRLAKKFVSIDEELMKISTNSDETGNFFSGVLSLEAKRLAFKEEVYKCPNQTSNPANIH